MDTVDRRRRAMATLAMHRAEQQRQQANIIDSMSSAANQSQSASKASKLMKNTHDGTNNTSCRVCHATRHQQASRRKCRRCDDNGNGAEQVLGMIPSRIRSIRSASIGQHSSTWPRVCWPTRP